MKNYFIPIEKFSTVYKNKKSCLNFPQNFALIKLIEKNSMLTPKNGEMTPINRKAIGDSTPNILEPITVFTVKKEKSSENITNISEKNEKGG